jgi:DNA-binding MarR family transcriptional regulator
MRVRDKEESITRELLTAIDERDDITQRHLAERMGVALGLTNSYLKRCIRKGLVKIKEVPANRYLYYLTPKGFAEKARLTASYLSASLSFYRSASDSCREVYKTMHQSGQKSVFLCGVSELAEIAAIRAMESKIEVVGALDLTAKQKSLLSVSVWHGWNEVEEFDICLITDIWQTNEYYRTAIERYGDDRVVVPTIISDLIVD